MKKRVNVSIVLFNHRIEDIQALILSLRQSNAVNHIFLIDNSPEEGAGFKLPDVIYIFNNKNLGYGAAHNIGIGKSIESGIAYHLVVNPDITLAPDVIDRICQFMEENPEVGQLMPKILYNDGEIQHLCKLLPTPFDLIGRRFFKKSAWAKRRNALYELQGFQYDKVINTASLSGCFMYFRTEVLQKTGGFDPRFFMYLEDYDLTRRVHGISKTILYPWVHVFHGYQKESYTNNILLKYHIHSAIKYFNKWGWFRDAQRKKYNSDVLSQIAQGTNGDL